MKISIITPSLNSEKTIRQTIESVICQTHKNLEYIIIDGGSTDGTLNIIKEYGAKFPLIFVSCPDQGLYDAMNKGLSLATGEIVGILNSDDLFYNEKVLEKIVDYFVNNLGVDAVYGDLVYFKDNRFDKITRFWRAGEYTAKRLNSGWIIPHPTLFIKKDFYIRHPRWFDLNFKIAGDYEMILRFLLVYKMKVKYLSEVLTRMRVGGTSGRNLKQRRLGWKELRLAWKINHLPLPVFFIWRRVLGKLHQFFIGRK
jgi:glycosyltransferase